MFLYKWVVVLIIVATYFFEEILEYVNDKARGRTVAPDFADLYDEVERARQNKYQHENYKVRLVEEVLSLIVLLSLILSGLFGVLDKYVMSLSASGVVQTLLFFAILYVAKEIFSLPFNYYRTFVIEEKYGFNKSTRATFWGDVMKSIILVVIIGGTVLGLAALFYEKSAEFFWVWGWLLVSGVTAFFAMFYTTTILPLFNKLTPLPEGELRDKILTFARDNYFLVKNIFVMDGSRRSSKANAFFSGFGSQKTIVLFDTLINTMTSNEVVAVLAHEVGHYKLKHARRQIVLGVLQTGVLFYLLALFLKYPQFANALGMEQSFYANIFMFSLVFTPIFSIINIGAMALSRSHEIEADKYAKDRNFGHDLSMALKNLTKTNYSNLTPHPLYVFFKYSHPPVDTRLKKLSK